LLDSNPTVVACDNIPVDNLLSPREASSGGGF
jgi:hypothetical protein